MKSKILPLILCCLLATSAYAHRDDYFGFTMGSDPSNDGWSVSGGTGQAVDGKYIVTATGNDPVVWTRDLQAQPGTKNQTYVSRAILKYISGTGAVNGIAHVVPKITLEGSNGEFVTFTFKTAPDNNSNEISDTASISSGAAFPGDVRYIKVIFENVQANEQVSFHYIDLASQWFMPQVSVDNTIYIQAEDYNESWINNRKGYSSIVGGTNNYRPADTDMYLAWQDDQAFFQSWAYGNAHVDNWYGFAVKNMCPNGGTWNTYSGAYIDNTANTTSTKITIDNAVKNWGTWLEYTFDVPVTCVADISLKAGSNYLAYSGVSGGTGKFNRARTSGGYTIDGLSEDWVKRYCASAVLSIDGNNLKTNWSAHPRRGSLTETTYAALIRNPSTGWMNNQILQNGNLVNNDTLYVFPDPNNMEKWSTYYKSDFYTALQTQTSDQTLAAYIKPDYANVYLSAGRHTLKVQSLAAMWHFDEMKIVAKTVTPTKNSQVSDSENLVVYPSLATNILHIKGGEVNYRVISLGSGDVLMTGFGNTVDISKLSAGVYAIKIGGNVQRFIKK